jgi:hypothetical protein
MANGNPIVNIDLAKPATVLIQKVSAALGGLSRPWQIRRVANAEADAAIIEAKAQIKVSDLERRAVERFVKEEAKRQENIESITEKAAAQLKDDAKPENLDNDWIANFFDKCRIVSDEQMQTLWGKVLAGEANAPGTYSKRTVAFLETLDKSDAALFETLCRFVWMFNGPIAFVYDPEQPMCRDHGLTFGTLTHLESLGLITFNSITGFSATKLPKTGALCYGYGQTLYMLEHSSTPPPELAIGRVLLSSVGRQLVPLCDFEPVEGLDRFVLGHWQKAGYSISSMYPRTTLAEAIDDISANEAQATPPENASANS